MEYVLAIIAGIWMADGLSLLVAPRFMMARLREVLILTPSIVRWEGVAVLLGGLLCWSARGLPYATLWMSIGVLMALKGLFLAVSPERWRRGVVDWCLHREAVDYRFWGLGLCTLSLLLLHALGWLPTD